MKQNNKIIRYLSIGSATITLICFCLYHVQSQPLKKASNSLVKPLVSVSTVDSAEVAALVQKIRAARLKLGCFQIDVNYSQELSPAFLAYQKQLFAQPPATLHSAGIRELAAKSNSQQKLRLSYQKGMVAYFLGQDESKAGGDFERLVWDGQRVKTVLQRFKPGEPGLNDSSYLKIGYVTEPKVLLKNSIWTTNAALDPRSYLYNINEQAVEAFILQSQVLKIGKEKLADGSAGLQVQVTSQAHPNEIRELVFDTTHDYLLRRQETYSLRSGQKILVGRIIVPQLVSNRGRWFPAVVIKDTTWECVRATDARRENSSALKLGSVKLPPIRERLVITDFDASCPVPASAFDFSWPLGTRVINQTTGTQFVVTAQNLREANRGLSVKGEVIRLPPAETDPNNHIGAAKPTMAVGDLAPDFAVKDMNGKTWQLSDLKGQKNLLLTFFPKCFTGGCINHLSSLASQQSEFDALDTQILAVSVDPAGGRLGQQQFAKRWNLSFPLIPDTERAFCLQYGTVQQRHQLSARLSFLIDKTGVVRFIDPKVNLQTHGKDMLRKIRSLGLG